MYRKITLISMLILVLVITQFVLAIYPSTFAAETTIGLEVVAEGLTAPMALVSPPDGTKRRFIVEQVGRIRILMPDGKMLPEPFLNISTKIVPLMAEFDERGLLGLAFHPDYKNNGRFFVYYSAPIRPEADLGTRLFWNHTAHLSEFKVSKDNPNKADPNSERILMQIDQPQFNHNGGALAFGPDGYLYISLGDGGFANDQGTGHPPMGFGQDTTALLGKILRIDVDKGDPYGIPPDNPFVGKDNHRPEIFALGFRNPWRISFDADTNALFVGDVGQNAWEEVDIVTKGGNYGWNKMEGTHCFDPLNPNEAPETCDAEGLIKPIIEYKNANVHTKDGQGKSVTGGYVYRGNAIPELKGKYVFGDWSLDFAKADGRLFIATPPAKKDEMWSMEELKVAGKQDGRPGLYILAFGQDADNELYVMAKEVTGPVGSVDKVYKIVPAK